MNPRVLLPLLVASIGCVGPEPDDLAAGDGVAAAAAALNGADTATSTYYRNAVFFPERHCTGTLISSRYVITSIWCDGATGDHVRFYLGSPVADTSTANTRTVSSERLATDVHLVIPPWGDNSSWDYEDGNGKFAELRIVHLNAAAPAGAVPITLAWAYPGSDASGRKVGAGEHDGSENDFGFLRTKLDTTRSSNDSDSAFLTNHQDTNDGDTGGGFVYTGRLLGVFSKGVYDWGDRAKYNSVPYRLNWILGSMYYAWPGVAPVAGRRLSGARLTTIPTTSHQVCQYACERTTYCLAYNFQTAVLNQPTANPTCELLSVTDGSFGNTYTTSALR
jgi:hypothetical protein